MVVYRNKRGGGCEMYALVHYYEFTNLLHPLMLVPRCRLQNPLHYNSCHVVTVESIVGHARMCPDFDDESNTHYWWDRLSLE
jgi:hypothetical protein